MTTYTQHFQGHPEGLPKGFFIERQGETYITTYTVTTKGEFGTVHRSYRFTTECNRALAFETLEEAQAFIHGFAAFVEWMSGIAASTPSQKMAA